MHILFPVAEVGAQAQIYSMAIVHFLLVVDDQQTVAETAELVSILHG